MYGGFFRIGGISAVAIGNGIFAIGGQHHKFVRKIPADSAGIGFHRFEFETAPLKNALVRIIHTLVPIVGLCIIGGKGVGVFHIKFARAHDPKAGADFVTEFGAELVQAFGQLFVGRNILAY